MKATFLFVFIVLLFGYSSKIQADTNLIVNEILPDATGADSGKEYVELYNISDTDINLNNAYLINTSQSGTSKKILLPSSKISAKSYFVFSEDLSLLQISNGLSLGSGKIALYNDFAKLELYNENVILHAVNYGDSKEGISWELDGPVCNNLQYSQQNSAGVFNSVGAQNCFEVVESVVSYPEVSIAQPLIKFSLDGVVWSDTISTFINRDVYFKYITDTNSVPNSVIWSDAYGNVITSPYKFSSVYNKGLSVEIDYNSQSVQAKSFDINIENNISNKVLITEAYPSPDTGDSEWIELYNNDVMTVDLANYILEEKSSSGVTNRRIPIGSFLLAPKSYYVIYEEDFNISLNNSGDEIYLIDINNNQIDKFIYKQVPNSQSVGRKLNEESFSNETFESFSPTPNKPNVFGESSKPVLTYQSLGNISSLEVGSEFLFNVNIVSFIDRYIFIQDSSATIKAKLTVPLESDLINTYVQLTAKVINLNGSINLEINPENIKVLDYLNLTPSTIPELLPTTDSIGRLVSFTGVIDQVYDNRIKVKLHDQLFNVYFNTPVNTLIIKKGSTINVTGVIDYYRASYRIIANEYTIPEVLSESISVSYPVSYLTKASSLIPQSYPEDNSRIYLVAFGYVALLFIFVIEIVNNRKYLIKRFNKIKSKIKIFNRPMIKY